MTAGDVDGLDGIIGACLTPFDAEGRVDPAALERELVYLASHVDAITVGAVEAAEYTMLTIAERTRLARRAVAVVDGRVPVIAGASAPSIGTVTELAVAAADAGADLVQVLMPRRPWGGEPAPDELLEYFSRVATASPLPVVAYHNPATGADPAVATWIALSELDGVVCFKESSRDISKISRLVEEIHVAGRARYFTTMQPLLPTLLLGGGGATMPPPATRIGAEVVRAVRDGDLDAARRWQRLFGLFPGRLARLGMTPVMKAALRHAGVDVGGPAAPYRPVPDDADAVIGRFVAASGLVDGVPPDDDRMRQLVADLGESPRA